MTVADFFHSNIPSRATMLPPPRHDELAHRPCNHGPGGRLRACRKASAPFYAPAINLLDKQISRRRMRTLPCLPSLGQAHIRVGRGEH